MDPVTFQLIIAAGTLGVQALTTLLQNKAALTPEQQAEADALVARIKAAQAMVTPYEKEKPV
jgi:hypothetical protein